LRRANFDSVNQYVLQKRGTGGVRVASLVHLTRAVLYKARRISWFYMMNGMTQIFGCACNSMTPSSILHCIIAFIAYGVSFIRSPFAPYRILFLLLGGLAILVGLVVIAWLPDSPVHARVLKEEEKIAALERVRDGQIGTANHHIKGHQVWEAVADIRTWLVVLTVLMSKFEIEIEIAQTYWMQPASPTGEYLIVCNCTVASPSHNDAGFS
jgi:hypothetical protein